MSIVEEEATVMGRGLFVSFNPGWRHLFLTIFPVITGLMITAVVVFSACFISTSTLILNLIVMAILIGSMCFSYLIPEINEALVPVGYQSEPKLRSCPTSIMAAMNWAQ